ncbi:carboxylesterase [Motilibacter peucedani]|uniref:Carboxylesterase n=1 Tax=Motilibacter peucedani TaxID=598650 RepID=A0A420XNC2_9ACTN|nr:alpha/beta fold hydrolase [Motilibacter peucedani]RKS72772.1 carboxylesterase [Motilibacter peucedani]
MTSVLPGAEPFSADGDRDGVGDGIGFVLSHGFTGSPASMRPWAEHLAAEGFTVRVPRLPGHGTTWQDANSTTWQDWYAEVEAAYDEVAARCSTVVAGGLSMGGTLVTRLAERRPLSGLVVVNPSYATERWDARLARWVSWAVRSRPAIGGDIKRPGGHEPTYDRTPVAAFASLQRLWTVTRRDFGLVRAPVLLFRSREDHVVEPLSAELLRAGATGTTVEEVVLEESYHVATLDNDAPLIFSRSVEFARGLVGRGLVAPGLPTP